MQGVLIARGYVMMDYDVPGRAGRAGRARSRPAWSRRPCRPLHDRGWVAVRAMVPRATTNRVMDELYDLGARAILVTDIHACRL